jgi:linoleoyl-CoA desaturase
MSTQTESLAELRQEIIARGWYRRATLRIMVELLFNLAIALAGIWIFLASQHLLVRICGLLISTAGSMGAATNTHTSSHYATSNRRWVNEMLTFLGYPLFMGVSACHWWHKHVVLHHPAPNVIGVDFDVDISPWFARTSEEVKRSSGLRRIYYEKLQWLFLPIAIPLIVFNMQAAGWRTLIGSLRQPGGAKGKQWIDLGANISHYFIWLLIPMAHFVPAHVIGFYLLRTALMGCAIFIVLAPGHYPEEAICLAGENRNWDRLLLQTAATVNFHTGRIGRLVCSGLEYQIEHHLFPTISHVYYPNVAPLVREFCRSQGLPYRCYPWGIVVWKCLCTFRTPPPVQPDLANIRSMSGAAQRNR